MMQASRCPSRILWISSCISGLRSSKRAPSLSSMGVSQWVSSEQKRLCRLLASIKLRASPASHSKRGIWLRSPPRMKVSGCHCTPRMDLPGMGLSMASMTPSQLRAETCRASFPLPVELTAWWWKELTASVPDLKIWKRSESFSISTVCEARQRSKSCECLMSFPANCGSLARSWTRVPPVT